VVRQILSRRGPRRGERAISFRFRSVWTVPALSMPRIALMSPVVTGCFKATIASVSSA
jgi:hypothetical protein